MKNYLILSALLAFVPAAAQTSLGDYRQAVTEYSWELKVAASKSDAASETMGQARTGYLPRLSLDGSFTATVHHYDGLERWNFSVLPQLVQTVYGGGAVRAAYKQAELGYDIALCDEEFTQLDVRYAAEYTYWNLSAMELYAASMRAVRQHNPLAQGGRRPPFRRGLHCQGRRADDRRPSERSAVRAGECRAELYRRAAQFQHPARHGSRPCGGTCPGHPRFAAAACAPAARRGAGAPSGLYGCPVAQRTGRRGYPGGARAVQSAGERRHRRLRGSRISPTGRAPRRSTARRS